MMFLLVDMHVPGSNKVMLKVSYCFPTLMSKRRASHLSPRRVSVLCCLFWPPSPYLPSVPEYWNYKHVPPDLATQP